MDDGFVAYFSEDGVERLGVYDSIFTVVAMNGNKVFGELEKSLVFVFDL